MQELLEAGAIGPEEAVNHPRGNVITLGEAYAFGVVWSFFLKSLGVLVLHINREMIHHGAEICLLRDLYLRRTDDEESA